MAVAIPLHMFPDAKILKPVPNLDDINFGNLISNSVNIYLMNPNLFQSHLFIYFIFLKRELKINHC